MTILSITVINIDNTTNSFNNVIVFFIAVVCKNIFVV